MACASTSVFVIEWAPPNAATSIFVFSRSPISFCLSGEALQDQQVDLTPSSFQITASVLDLRAGEILRFCKKQKQSLCFLQSSDSPVCKTPWPSTPDVQGIHLPIAGPLGLRSPMYGSDPSFFRRNLCNHDHLSFVGHLHRSMGLDYTIPLPS